jgi:hypothetical protein
VPTRSEFFLYFRSLCTCAYSLQTTSQEYVNASEFFLRELGDFTSVSCDEIYFHTEFFRLEHRHPANIEEFDAYIRNVTNVALSLFNVGWNQYNEYENNNPVDPSKIESLKSSAAVISGQSCGICQEEISGQRAVKLDCNHFFHADNCCETGTIFTWFENNNRCPICRAEI